MKVRALKENEKEEMYEMLYRAYAEHFENKPYLKNFDYFRNIIESDPFFDLDLNRVLEVDGKLVARIGIYDRKMYFKGKTLRVGAIGGVGTDPLHRGKGYTRILLENCTEYMGKNGFDISMLFGEPVIYGKSGWLTMSSFGISTNFIIPCQPSVSFSSGCLERDIETLFRIYNQFNLSLNGPFERTKQYWNMWLKSRINDSLAHDEITLLHDNEDICGYYISKNKNLIIETGWDRENSRSFEKVMASIFNSAESDVINFKFFLPEIFNYISEKAFIPSLDDIKKQEYYLKKTIIYSGLFKLISNKAVEDVATSLELINMLRQNNYNFWNWDHF